MAKISVTIDASDFETEIENEERWFRDSVLQTKPYPLVRLLTTDALYPANASAVTLLERRGNLEPSNGFWVNNFGFATSALFRLKQNGNIIRLWCEVPKNVSLRISGAASDDSVVEFVEPWMVRVVDSFVVKGRRVRLETPVRLESVRTLARGLRYEFKGDGNTPDLTLEALYDSPGPTKIDFRVTKSSDFGNLTKFLIATSLTEGICNPIGEPHKQPPSPPPGSNINLHIRVLESPNVALATQITNAVDLYQNNGYTWNIITNELLDLPDSLDIEIDCFAGRTHPDQDTLYQNRAGIGLWEVAVYYVRTTDPPTNGCASFRIVNQPACVVTRTASAWTLAHEIGHVLGLNHVDDNTRLMTGGGTGSIVDPPPDLVPDEVDTIEASPYTVA